MRILYIAVNYRTPRHAEAFAKCFERDPRDSVLVLVDNSEPDWQLRLDIAPAMAKAIHCCATPQNLGYFGGVRYGLSTPMARNFNPDWVVVSNVDLTFDPTQIRRALAERDATKVGAIAPAITSRISREKLNPFMASRPTRARMRAYKLVFRYYPTFAAYSLISSITRRRAWMRGHATDESTDREIYAPHGALIILSREFFRRVGGLEHPPFLFGEEITIAEQARRASLPILYCPKIAVTHEQHASTSRLPGRLQHELLSRAAAHVADVYFR